MTKNYDELWAELKNKINSSSAGQTGNIFDRPTRPTRPTTEKPEWSPGSGTDLEDLLNPSDPGQNGSAATDPPAGEVPETGEGSVPSRVDYSQKIDELIRGIIDRDPFSYDYEKDPTWQQYRKAYTREGERAMQDAIAAISGRTGGLASSYATTAATQANDYYMSQLADKIPELRDAAYSMYQNNLQNDRQNLQLLESARADARARVADFIAAKGKIEDLDPNLVSASGYTQAELEALRKAALLNKTSSGGVSYSSSSGSSSGTGYSGNANQHILQIYKELDSAVDPYSYLSIAYPKMTAGEIQYMIEGWKQYRGKSNPSPTPSPTDNTDDLPADSDGQDDVMTEEEIKDMFILCDNRYEVNPKDDSINWVNVSGLGKLEWDKFVNLVQQRRIVVKNDYRTTSTGEKKMTSSYWVKA